MPNLAAYLLAVKPLRVVKRDPKDPDWKFPYASREYIDYLRQYFAAFATRNKDWHDNPHTHVLPPKERRPDIPWYTVPEQHREKVEIWFQRKLAEWKASGRPLTRGKLQSLRMNATVFGRYILTGKRRANHARYDRHKRVWLTYLSWEAQQDRREVELSRPFAARKVLDT
jgi:hypothetical protein